VRLTEKEKIEIDYWRSSPASDSDLHSSNSLKNVINKVSDAGVFLTCLLPFESIFAKSGSILEIGAGQGWAACVVKRLFPGSTVAATDISRWALVSLPSWERVFQTRIDRVFCSTSYQIPVADGSVDCVFTFASAHHFGAQRRTLKDIYRVLRPGGHCFYFHEPACPRLWHWLASWRVNRKRSEVPEDVLIHSKIRQLAAESGFACQVLYDASLYKREPLETIYYGLLRFVPAVQPFLPCTATFHFEKRRS
jgi:SAM-dependent methyltransferase